MKFALINTYCGYGSTGNNMINNYNRLTSLGHEVKAFYGIRKQKFKNKDFVFFGNCFFLYLLRYHIDEILGTMGLFCVLPTIRLIHSLKEYKPNIVWLSNIHGDYVNEYWLLSFLKKNKILTVWGLPDEYAFLGKCCSVTECKKYLDKKGCSKCPRLRTYPRSYIFDNSHLKFKLKQKAYNGFDKLILRSAPYVINNARNSVLLGDKEMYESDSSIDTENIFYPRENHSLYERFSIGRNTRVILTCAPFKEPLKGVKYLLDAAKECEQEDILFLNIAFDADKSICPKNYIPLPYIKDKNIIADYYSLADAYVCTSLSDAQPNTCLEALACGTPIIGFNISGVPFIAPNKYGVYVEPKNTCQLASAIKAVKKKTPETINGCRQYAESRFGIKASEKRFNDFIDMICERVVRSNSVKNEVLNEVQ